MILLEFIPKSQTCNLIGLILLSLPMIEMVAQLKVSANKFIETFPSNSSMLKYGVKVVSLSHKRLDLIMSSKTKMFFKFTKAKPKDKSKKKKLKKIKRVQAKSNQLRRKRNEKVHALLI